MCVAGSIIFVVVNVFECEEGAAVGENRRLCGFPPPRWERNTLRNADRLNDLEDCGPTHHEDEQREQPGTDRVLLFGVLRRLGDVSALGDVAAGLLVGHTDSLLGSHCALCDGLYVQITRTGRKKGSRNRC